MSHSFKPLRIEASGFTHPGRVRRQNEDAFGVHTDLGLFVVADGMGGHAGGEIASRLAVEAVAAHVQEVAARSSEPPSTGRGGRGERRSFASAPGPRPVEVLVSAVQRANAAVLEAARRNTAESDMGTTIACVLARGDRTAVAHVGDSRVYRYRDRRLEALTEDHSLLAECLRSGYLTPDLVESFPYKHLITRSLGAEDHLEVDARVLEPQHGDVLLLCSDGLCGVIGDQDIARVLEAEGDLDTASKRLIDRANEEGGPDNVTVVLVRWTAS
jgi:protein phosphatase